MARYLKLSVLLFFLFLFSTAANANDLKGCDAFADIARNVAIWRDQGIPREISRGAMVGMAKAVFERFYSPNKSDQMAMSLGFLVDFAYDHPEATPDQVYGLAFMACMGG